jgi:CheY-like chemotaxis protein
MAKRILVVDDQPAIAAMLKESLEELGYEVETASNGKEAIVLHERHPHDLVISDIFMPEKDGLELLTYLRKEGSTAKIIAISGGGHSADPGLFLNIARITGAHRIITKPFERKVLLAAVEELLKEGGSSTVQAK